VSRPVLATLAAVVALAGGPQAAGAAVPEVETMVVGRGAVLHAPSEVPARATRVRAGGRPCAVAAGTPLAALDATRRAGGPGFRLRDYGSCSATPRDAGQLFVFQVGPDRNAGSDGWVYKVDGRAGSTGGGDPRGPFGDGRRLRSGQRVLWFYCRMGPAGCQETLGLSLEPARAAPGDPVTAVVQAYDDRGSARPVPGATVEVAGTEVVTDAGGVAPLFAPAAPGVYPVRASAPDLVPAFPARLAVR